MDTLLRDVAGALRGFRANKSFTLVAVTCLSLGIAADTAIFSVFESTLMRRLPFDRPDQLVSISLRDERTGRRSRLPYPRFVALRDAAGAVGALEASAGRTVAVTDGTDRAELVGGQLVSAGFLPLLGVEPRLGRGLLAEDDRPGAAPVVLVSDALWRRRYGGSDDVLGGVVDLDSSPHTIVGVLPPGFRYPGSTDVWLPMGAVLRDTPLEAATVSTVGRVGDGPGATVVAAELEEAGRRTAPVGTTEVDGPLLVEARPLGATFLGGEERLVTVAMMGAVSFLLLLACANVASLLLVRASARERELALRAALGAGRRRLVQQVLVESVLLAVVATAVALPMAAWGLRAFGAAVPPSDPLPFFVTFTLSRPALLYTSGLALVTGVAYGLAPALLGSGAPPMEALRADGHGSGLAPRRARVLSVLVVTEVALAMTLLVGGSLFARTFVGLRGVELGYDPSRIMTMRFHLPGPAYDGREARLATVLDIERRLRAIPGVEHATISDLIPLEDDGGATERVELDEPGPGGRERELFYAGVLGEWLATFDVTPLAGRDFEDAELRRGARVAVINRTMAAEFWPGREALDRRFRFVGDSTGLWYTVVGVIPDMRTVKLDESQRTPPTAFVPIHALDARDFGAMMRTAASPTSVTAAARDAVAAADADVPTYKVWPMDDVKWLSFWMYGLWGATFAAFAAVALLLAAIGVYGVISFGVKERRHEIGVRIALGASRAGVVRLVVGRAARLAALGLALGLAASYAVGGFVDSLLIGVSAGDPATYGGVVVFLAAVAVAASLVPALRAARVDAVVAMRR